MSADQVLYSRLRRDAEANYSPASAAGYREADDAARESSSHAGKCRRDQRAQSPVRAPITALDLGCGTGRYFHCLDNVGTLIGVDPSENMLTRLGNRCSAGPKRPPDSQHAARSGVRSGDFDLVVCIGVIGLWCPLEPLVLQRIGEMLKPAGVLFFSAIEYQPTPPTLKRRIASAVKPLLFGPPRRYVDVSLRDFGMPAPVWRR